MAGFKASEAVEALEIDLSPYGPTGVIPEPSVAQVDALRLALKSVFEAAQQIEAPESSAELLGEVSKLSEQEQDVIVDQVTDAIITIIGTVVTREQFDALPARIQRAFQGWLLGSLLVPEGLRPATTA